MRAWIALAALVIASHVRAEDTGTWAKAGSASQINAACLQVWRCGPSNAILHDPRQKVDATSPQSTMGVCSAGSGPVDSCNVCLASPPTKECRWKLVRK